MKFNAEIISVNGELCYVLIRLLTYYDLHCWRSNHHNVFIVCSSFLVCVSRKLNIHTYGINILIQSMIQFASEILNDSFSDVCECVLLCMCYKFILFMHMWIAITSYTLIAITSYTLIGNPYGCISNWIELIQFMTEAHQWNDAMPDVITLNEVLLFM